ncbi:hypothetical protein EUTSA_v10010944mg [Eutrema salsugineum]|uniref:SUEL-type lectin domain-containing protein n=1 Tax=Eutrema salsugineum TaxID=72664 RepID=V4LZ54_EUTSA|nr:beta-galactosidase 15 [Eutrema salsugineum]ESQ45183.1 hypothetical protein EUTSA_v10010944mg [Eutrema salsugineum]
MNTSHCHHGFIILLLVLFHSSLFAFASKIDVYHDARRIQIEGDRKHIPSHSNRNPRQQGKEYSACTNHKSVQGPITRIFCNGGYVITKINFADYGNPTGTCEHFRHGNCGALATLRLVEKNCLGKTMCILFVTDEMFGPSHCKGALTLAVEATCTKK